MKKLLFHILLLSATTLVFPATSQAQYKNKGEKEYWKDRKEHAKKRDEYYREQNKKRDEYYREIDKKQRKYDKEWAKDRKEYWKDRRGRELPGWARKRGYDARHHVYFRDYDTFYDPHRGGYVYMDGKGWAFSVDIPSILVNVDLGAARILLMTDVPLNRHPENYYEDYDDDYDD